MKIQGIEYNLYVNLELKDFIGKDEIIEKIDKNISLEELENVIDELNSKNKNKVSYFLISKEDDEESNF